MAEAKRESLTANIKKILGAMSYPRKTSEELNNVDTAIAAFLRYKKYGYPFSQEEPMQSVLAPETRRYVEDLLEESQANAESERTPGVSTYTDL